MDLPEESIKKRRVEVLDFLKEEQYSDVTFQIGKKSIHANRSTLAAISPVLRTMLYGQMQESKPDSLVQIPDIDGEAFKCIIRYSFGIDPEIDEHNCIQVKAITDKYQINSLDPFLDNYILDLLCPENFCRYISELCQIHCSNLITKCFQKLKKFSDLNPLLSSQSFLETPPNVLSMIIESEGLHVNEEALWKNCLKWAHHQALCCVLSRDKLETDDDDGSQHAKYKSTRKEFLDQIKNGIRFPLMKAEFLVQKVYPEEVLASSDYAAIISDIVSPNVNPRSTFCARRRFGWPASYVVSCAGTTFVNGTYHFDGNFFAGVPIYCKHRPDGEKIQFRSNGDVWFFGVETQADTDSDSDFSCGEYDGFTAVYYRCDSDPTDGQPNKFEDYTSTRDDELTGANPPPIARAIGYLEA